MKRKEPLRLIVNATCGPDFGKYQATLDGVKIGEPMDFYAAEIVQQGISADGLLARAGHLHAAARHASARTSFPTA